MELGGRGDLADRVVGGEVVMMLGGENVGVNHQHSGPRKHARSLAGDCWLEPGSGIQVGGSRSLLSSAPSCTYRPPGMLRT